MSPLFCPSASYMPFIAMIASPLPRQPIPWTQSTPLCALAGDSPLGLVGSCPARRTHAAVAAASAGGARSWAQNSQTGRAVKTWIDRERRRNSCSARRAVARSKATRKDIGPDRLRGFCRLASRVEHGRDRRAPWVWAPAGGGPRARASSTRISRCGRACVVRKTREPSTPLSALVARSASVLACAPALARRRRAPRRLQRSPTAAARRGPDAATRSPSRSAPRRSRRSRARPGGGRWCARSIPSSGWACVSPTFNPQGGLGPTDTDCTGHYLFANESLRGGISTKGWPRPFDPDELEVRAGPEGMRVIWLRVLKFENGDVGGPVALVRAVDDRAEVYGIGSFRGPPKSKIVPVRVGNENLAVAESDHLPRPRRLPQARRLLPRAPRPPHRLGAGRPRAHAGGAERDRARPLRQVHAQDRRHLQAQRHPAPRAGAGEDHPLRRRAIATATATCARWSSPASSASSATRSSPPTIRSGSASSARTERLLAHDGGSAPQTPAARRPLCPAPLHRRLRHATLDAAGAAARAHASRSSAATATTSSARRAPTSSSTRTTPSTGTRGAPRPSSARGGSAASSSSPWATPPATGAT